MILNISQGEYINIVNYIKINIEVTIDTVSITTDKGEVIFAAIKHKDEWRKART